MQETQVWYLDQEDALEKEMATHSSSLAWEISWIEAPGGLQSMGVTKSWTGLIDTMHAAFITFYTYSMTVLQFKHQI